MDTWLSAMSKFLAPGAMIWSKLSFTQVTWSLSKPSCSATAYATADSKPLPVEGSLSRTQGSYAGSDVATVRTPVLSVESEPSLALGASPEVSSVGAQAANARA